MKRTPPPDLPALVESAQAGDLESYIEMVRRFQDMAVGYAYSVLGDFHLAQDAAQEAFLEAQASLEAAPQPRSVPRLVQDHHIQTL